MSGRFQREINELRRTIPTIRVILRVLIPAIERRIRRMGKWLLRQKRRDRLGVDIRPFYENLTGVGWYLYYLLDEFRKRDDVDILCFGDAFVTDGGPRLHVDLPPRCDYVFFDLRAIPLSKYSAPVTKAAFVFWQWLEECDMYFGANFFLPQSMALIARKRVVTVHDLTFRRYPELLQAETLANLTREMQRELFRSDRVLCVSNSTRSELLRYFDCEPEKAIAVHSGLTHITTPPEAVNVPRSYLLFVSTIEPRKNLDGLIDAFEMLKDEGRYNGSLLVVGKVGWKSEATMERLRNSRWRSDIHHLNYVTRGSLAYLYKNARVFVFPSHYEGFGFPLLEAMSFGVPTVAARSSSLPEIGGDASLYFEPGNTRELADAIARLDSSEELRQQLASRGLERAESFTWQATAKTTYEVFREVMGR